MPRAAGCTGGPGNGIGHGSGTAEAAAEVAPGSCNRTLWDSPEVGTGTPWTRPSGDRHRDTEGTPRVSSGNSGGTQGAAPGAYRGHREGGRTGALPGAGTLYHRPRGCRAPTWPGRGRSVLPPPPAGTAPLAEPPPGTPRPPGQTAPPRPRQRPWAGPWPPGTAPLPGPPLGAPASAGCAAPPGGKGAPISREPRSANSGVLLVGGG